MFSRLVVVRLRSLSVAAAAAAASSSSYNRIPPFRYSYLVANSTYFLRPARPFSTDPPRNGDDSGTWKLTPESEEGASSIFGDEGGILSGITEETISRDAFRVSEPASTPMRGADLSWSQPGQKGDFFENIEKEERVSDKGRMEVVANEWETAEGYKPWSLGGGDIEKEGVFDIVGDGGEGIEGIGDAGIIGQTEEKEGDEERKQLEMREQELLSTLKGPNRAFGDLIAASGITEDMIDSLILLKDASGVPGLPPLSVIEDKAIARMNATSTRGEIERKKQEESQKARVRQVDEKGRAYGTGRRKCSIARVWIQPGDGKFIVNDKQFDAYFPILDQRAELLRPFTVTKTLGLWDVNCTVKGGGVSGQVGAIRLGISRALQNWEPGLRSYLKSAGYMTRDPRVVERKKPGKAKARKSFQWVKR